MDVFSLRDQLVKDYSNYIQGFINISDERVRQYVQSQLMEGLLWPESLIQLNPLFEKGGTIDELAGEKGILHPECKKIFRRKYDRADLGKPIELYKHQADAIEIAQTGRNYILTTGTASGKSLAYIIPIVDHILKNPKPNTIKAIIVYPMNALANSQQLELDKYINFGYPNGKGKVTFELFTGQEKEETRERIKNNPPDILLTNYVMLELLLTRPRDKVLVQAAKNLRYFVLDELHTYRGRQGADVALLVRRLSQAVSSGHIQYIGTSATLANKGSFADHRREVAAVGSKLFGAEIKPEDVIAETIKRKSDLKPVTSLDLKQNIEARIKDGVRNIPDDFAVYLKDPLTIWLEETIGIQEKEGRLVRALPLPIRGPESAATKLALFTGLSEDICAETIKDHLLTGYKLRDEEGNPVFAFRLHQFISRGDTVYSTIESPADRLFATQGQRFHPEAKEKVILPLVFCRECGQEFYTVFRSNKEGKFIYQPRQLNDRGNDDLAIGEAGFLFVSEKDAWPIQESQYLDRVPDTWKEEFHGAERIKRDRRDDLPRVIKVNDQGQEDDSGMQATFIPAPFRFCPACGVAYQGRKADFSKLASLATEGRSTATTVLNFAALCFLKSAGQDLSPEAQKILSFMDNRQDAALQTGHFNDFIQIGQLRSAVYKAVMQAGPEGLNGFQIIEKVFTALALDPHDYANNPDPRFGAKEDADSALRQVLAYHLYRDLERGWRITAPNLEQCGLLRIEYSKLGELAEADDVWRGCHPELVNADSETRREICKVLLDFLRRELTIKVECLDPLQQERIRAASYQHLFGPWALDEEERLVTAGIALPRSSTRGEFGGNKYISARSGFGLYIRHMHFRNISMADTQSIIQQLFDKMEIAGLVERVRGRRNESENEGFRLKADRIIWLAGDGVVPYYDPIRIPRKPKTGGRTNPFFVDFYREGVCLGKILQAREHSAQVDAEDRKQREKDFKEGRLKILFCSPTMELGIDIAELNVVNMRNIPPTPANYVQRSGRAGRHGQPALVFTYCSSTSPHDQYYFRRPYDMVSGAVAAPRLDLGNEDLVKAHIHSLFLTIGELKLGESLVEILELGAGHNHLSIKEELKNVFKSTPIKEKVLEVGKKFLKSIEKDLDDAAWYHESWLAEVIQKIELDFETACLRWWSLYDAAVKQLERQGQIATDLSRPQEERDKAMTRRREAESQFALLTDTRRIAQADFYSYRYFASEGFLPGFNFPRLPISAYLPASTGRRGNEGFLSRPRFLAISEFGPRAIIYHEGSRYRIERAILPLRSGEDELPTTNGKRCQHCGYFHPPDGQVLPDLCHFCGQELAQPYTHLFRMQNVSTRRIQRINSDEEERRRLGYEIQTAIRFNSSMGQSGVKKSRIMVDGECFAELTYCQTATITRLNLGWMRRADKDRLGFMMDLEWGRWERNQAAEDDEDNDDTRLNPELRRPERVIPYVEDRRNCLIFKPTESLDSKIMASLQSAFKVALQLEFQLEDIELAVEALPSREDHRFILFYESSEGGAGILKRLVEESQTLKRVVRKALEICHYNPDNGEDLLRAPHAREGCVAACYDCLMSYHNQYDHRILDRRLIKDMLLKLRNATLESSPNTLNRKEHLETLLRRCDSDLEREWLQLLEKHSLHLPSRSQVLMEDCGTRPDFIYDGQQVVVYIDGPVHEFPDRQNRDKAQQNCLEDKGYLVLRFSHKDDWMKTLAAHQGIFGGMV